MIILTLFTLLLGGLAIFFRFLLNAQWGDAFSVAVLLFGLYLMLKLRLVIGQKVREASH